LNPLDLFKKTEFLLPGMDIFAHGLWAGATYKAINLKKIKPLEVWRAVGWGIAPDIFAFSPAFIWLVWSLAAGNLSLADWPQPEKIEPLGHENWPIFQLASALYNISHSLAIFLLAAGLVAFFVKKIPWEMGGWLLHILIDIPTHSYKFYPTPFLWPFSEWKFDGWSWGNFAFMIVNYSLLAIIYLWIWIKKRKKSANLC